MEEDAIVLYAPPLMGHIVSTTVLAKLILRQRPKLSITILYCTLTKEPPTTSAVIADLITSNPTISFVHLPPPPTSAVDPTCTLNRLAFNFKSIRHNAPDVLSALGRISEKSTIRAFVIDLFCATALPIATDQLGIPTYHYFTSGAAALAAYLHVPTAVDAWFSGCLKDFPDLAIQFPGLPPIPAIQLPLPLHDRDDPSYDEFVYFCSGLAKSKGIIVNTFDELEPVALAAVLSGRCVPDSPTPPVYNVGPIISADIRNNSSSSSSRHECLLWLDSQPSKSVVFLCFGSRGTHSPAQIKEIANGLEMCCGGGGSRSGRRFLWVLKSPSDPRSGSINIDRLLPDGFLERTKERGMVVKSWAPQMAVLRHGSVAAFVTHCGWNSVLEAVVTGQPMVAWPLYAEQHINRAALVIDMGMAITVNKWEGDDGLVSGAELASRINELLDSDKGREVRAKTSLMKEKALAAIGEGGSSMASLQKLLDLWCHDD